MYILRLAEAISSLQEVRQELEKKLQRIQHLRRSCEGTREKKCVYCKKKKYNAFNICVEATQAKE